jgi:hypothetical protein
VIRTAASFGQTAALFVSNALNGTVAAKGAVVHRGTVLRPMISFPEGMLPTIQSVTKVGSGFAEHTDLAAFEIGPTGLATSSPRAGR